MGTLKNTNQNKTEVKIERKNEARREKAFTL